VNSSSSSACPTPHHAIDDRNEENQSRPFCAEQLAEVAKKFLWKANWNATSDTLVKKGRAVQIIAVEGLTTKVKPETRGRGPMFEEFAKLLVWVMSVVLLAVIIQAVPPQAEFLRRVHESLQRNL
jgi:hypothetical protein